MDLINEEDVEFTVIANILTDENTAEGTYSKDSHYVSTDFFNFFTENDDFVPIGSNVFVDLESTDGRRQRCYTIAIIDDDDIEPNETFLVELRPNSLFTPPNVVFMPGQITVTIIDDDGRYKTSYNSFIDWLLFFCRTDNYYAPIHSTSSHSSSIHSTTSHFPSIHSTTSHFPSIHSTTN